MHLPEVNVARILEIYPPTTPEAREEMILLHVRLALMLARRYAPCRNDVPDYQGEALVALVEIVNAMPTMEKDPNPTMYIHISLSRRLAVLRFRNRVVPVGRDTELSNIQTVSALTSPVTRDDPAFDVIVSDIVEVAQLNEKEHMVLRMMQEGRSGVEIGAALGATKQWGNQLRHQVEAKLRKAYEQ